MKLMELVAIITLLCGFLLIVVIATMLVRLYLMVRDQGLQIQILLKNDKESFVQAQRWNTREAWSRAGPNQLMPTDKQYVTKGQSALSTSTRTWQPCHILTSEQLQKQKAASESGIAGVAETAKEVGESVETTLMSGGGALSGTNVKRETVVFTDDLPATDQRGVNETTNDMYSERQSPAFLNSSTEGFKQLHESSKARFRQTHKAGHIY